MTDKRPEIRKTWKVSWKLTILSFLCGVLLGIFAKWLDTIVFDSSIFWHVPLETLNLGVFFSEPAVWILCGLAIAVSSGNMLQACCSVFVFFAGVCGAYHLYTVLFCGFNPGSYMKIWYGITLISPLLAVLCRRAKEGGLMAYPAGCSVFAVLTLSCFSLGMFYIDPKGILYVIVYVCGAMLLYRSPKQTLIMISAGLLMAMLYAISPLAAFIGL